MIVLLNGLRLIPQLSCSSRLNFNLVCLPLLPPAPSSLRVRVCRTFGGEAVHSCTVWTVQREEQQISSAQLSAHRLAEDRSIVSIKRWKTGVKLKKNLNESLNLNIGSMFFSTLDLSHSQLVIFLSVSRKWSEVGVWSPRSWLCVRVFISDADGMEQLSVSSDSPLSDNSDGEAAARRPEQPCSMKRLQLKQKLQKVVGQTRTSSCRTRLHVSTCVSINQKAGSCPG